MSDVNQTGHGMADGCSGCHMSFLDMDERLLELSSQFDLVYSPLVDRKDFPEHVDVTLVEGAVEQRGRSEQDPQDPRAHPTCWFRSATARVTGNVPAMRNPFGVQPVMLARLRRERRSAAQVPTVGRADAARRVRPVHEVVPVDVFVPGCPPSADTIYHGADRAAGRHACPTLARLTRFGALEGSSRSCARPSSSIP